MLMIACVLVSTVLANAQFLPDVYPIPPVLPLNLISKPLIPILTPITQLLQSILNLLQPRSISQMPPSQSSTSVPPSPAKPVDMKLLILATDGTEPGLAASQAFLDRLGTPYQVVLLAKGQSLPSLDNGTKGFYQGIILTTGNLGICDPTCRSALSTSDWKALDTYAKNYSVRSLSYYTFPDPRYGLSYTGVVATSDSSPALVNFTFAAADVFPYLTRAAPVKVANAYMYLASAVAASGETTTPLLTNNGAVVAVTHTAADGRQSLALTMDNNPYLLHSELFHYGLIRWLTRGVFLGSRQAYLTPQVDDLFLNDDLFVSNTPACIPVGFAADPTFDPANQCPALRISGGDLNSLAAWQQKLRANAQSSQFRVSLAFNGFGATLQGGAAAGDSLVAAARTQANAFYWVNHTYDHEDLDCYQPVPNSGQCAPASQSQSQAEISNNNGIGASLGLAQDLQSMVTPGISGLTNPAFLSAAAAQGIRYLVSDLSRPEGTPAIPNTAIPNLYQPGILEIPRRPTNIFYNTTTAFQSFPGSEPDEYNYFYGPNGIFRVGGPGGPAFFTSNQTYQQITDRESDVLLGYMLRYEMYPVMYHQSNLYRYDGVNSLFTDVTNAVISKFKALSSLPIVSMKQSDLGQLLGNRLAYMTSQVSATITPGTSIQITGAGAAVVPMTGVCSDSCVTYGGDKQSSVKKSASLSRTILLLN